jgi:hypothetical protein
MKNEGNNSNTLLATVLIFALWLMHFASVGLLSELCNGNYFWWRIVAMYPFTVVNFKVSRIVWNHYR